MPTVPVHLKSLWPGCWREDIPAVGNSVLAIFNKGFGFIDKHDGDIVPDLIYESAGCTDKAIFFFIQLKWSFAFGAGNNVKQFLSDHDVLFVWVVTSEISSSLAGFGKLIVF